MRLTATLFLLLVASSVSAPAQQAAPTAARQMVSAPALPERVDPFRLYDTSIHADPLLGTYYQYLLGRNVSATVAVQPNLWPAGEPQTADEVISRAVRSFKSLSRTVPGGLRGFEILRDTADTLVIGTRRVPGHVVSARVQRGAEERIETWYVYFFGSHYVRVMGAIPSAVVADPQAPLRGAIDAFVRDAMPVVVSAWRL